MERRDSILCLFWTSAALTKTVKSYHLYVVLTGSFGKSNRTQWTKENVWNRSSYLGKIESTCAGSLRCQRQIDSLCRLLCIRVCAFATFFHLTRLDTFPPLLFFPLSCRQLCLFHVLFCFIVCSCTADFYHSHSALQQTNVSVIPTDTWLENMIFLAWSCMCQCVKLQTDNNGCESHTL